MGMDCARVGLVRSRVVVGGGRGGKRAVESEAIEA